MKVAAPWRSPGVGLVVLLLLLAILAVLQFRWTGELSRAEHERQTRGLQSSARRMAHELDREISIAFLSLRPPMTRDLGIVAGHLADAFAEWRRRARYPELVHALWIVERAAGDPPGPARVLILERSGTAFRAASPEEWKTVLPLLRLPGAPRDRRSGLARVDPKLPGLILPLAGWSNSDPSGRRERWSLGYEIVQFDREALAGHILPELAADFFPEGPAVYLATGTGGEIPLTAAARDAGRSRQKLSVPLLQLLARDEIREMRSRRQTRRSTPLFPSFFVDRPDPSPAHGWRLVIRDPGGALDSAVSRARLRNLALGLAVLALLGLSAVALFLLTRRAQGLARRQIEFTSAVSHELRTPLASIRSLGQNLGDGIVKEPEQVRRYGRHILQESIRLADLVERTLELGGVLSGRSRGRLQPVALAAAARDALAECAPLFAQKGVDAVSELPAGETGWIRGDAEALRRAVVNLLANAVKFGASRVTVRLREAGGTVELAVVDDGPGIPRRELPHLFEPFFRGRRAIEGQIAGSGLGLSLVRHTVETSGGTLRVESREDEGTTFTLRWRQDGAADPNPAG